MLPVVTNIGLEIPFLFTGAIVTETIFSWPGHRQADDRRDARRSTTRC